MSQRGRITCSRCHTEFEIEVPSLAVLNGPEACVVVMHPRQFACPGPGCDAVYQPAIHQAQVTFSWPEVAPKQNGNRIVVPGLGPRQLPKLN